MPRSTQGRFPQGRLFTKKRSQMQAREAKAIDPYAFDDIDSDPFGGTKAASKETLPGLKEKLDGVKDKTNKQSKVVLRGDIAKKKARSTVTETNIHKMADNLARNKLIGKRKQQTGSTPESSSPCSGSANNYDQHSIPSNIMEQTSPCNSTHSGSHPGITHNALPTLVPPVHCALTNGPGLVGIQKTNSTTGDTFRMPRSPPMSPLKVGLSPRNSSCLGGSVSPAALRTTLSNTSVAAMPSPISSTTAKQILSLPQGLRSIVKLPVTYTTIKRVKYLLRESAIDTQQQLGSDPFVHTLKRSDVQRNYANDLLDDGADTSEDTDEELEDEGMTLEYAALHAPLKSERKSDFRGEERLTQERHNLIGSYRRTLQHLSRTTSLNRKATERNSRLNRSFVLACREDTQKAFRLQLLLRHRPDLFVKKPPDKYRLRGLEPKRCCFLLSGADDDETTVYCESDALPYTNHCAKHILENENQQLFDRCASSVTDSKGGAICSVPRHPVLDVYAARLSGVPICASHSRDQNQATVFSAGVVPPRRKKPRLDLPPPPTRHLSPVQTPASFIDDSSQSLGASAISHTAAGSSIAAERSGISDCLLSSSMSAPLVDDLLSTAAPSRNALEVHTNRIQAKSLPRSYLSGNSAYGHHHEPPQQPSEQPRSSEHHRQAFASPIQAQLDTRDLFNSQTVQQQPVASGDCQSDDKILDDSDIVSLLSKLPMELLSSGPIKNGEMPALHGLRDEPSLVSSTDTATLKTDPLFVATHTGRTGEALSQDLNHRSILGLLSPSAALSPFQQSQPLQSTLPYLLPHPQWPLPQSGQLESVLGGVNGLPMSSASSAAPDFNSDSLSRASSVASGVMFDCNEERSTKNYMGEVLLHQGIKNTEQLMSNSHPQVDEASRTSLHRMAYSFPQHSSASLQLLSTANTTDTSLGQITEPARSLDPVIHSQRHQQQEEAIRRIVSLPQSLNGFNVPSRMHSYQQNTVYPQAPPSLSAASSSNLDSSGIDSQLLSQPGLLLPSSGQYHQQIPYDTTSSALKLLLQQSSRPGLPHVNQTENAVDYFGNGR